MSGGLTPPGAPPAPGGGSPAAPHGVPATLTDVPPAIRQLSSGTLLQAMLVDFDARGRLLLHSKVGQLVVASKLRPPRGAVLTLQLRSTGGQLYAFIMQVQEPQAPAGEQPGAAQPRTGSGASASSRAETTRSAVLGSRPAVPSAAKAGGRGAATAPSGTAPAPALGADGDVLAVGTPLRALVQASAASPEAPPAGSELWLRVLQVRPAPEPHTAGETTGPPSTRQPAVASARRSPGASAGQPAGVSTAQSVAAATEQSGRPSAGRAGHAPMGQTAAAAAPSTSAGSAFAAAVIGADAAGRPLLETPFGTLQLALRASLPAGTRLLLETAPTVPAESGTTAEPRPAPTAATLARTWPALQEVVDNLQGTAPAAPPGRGAEAEPALVRALPQPGPRLASGILFFLSALAGGDLSAWLGREATRALEQAERGELIGRLARDFGQLGRLASESGGDWRLLPVPVLVDGEVRPLRLFLRRRGHDGGEGKGEGDGAGSRGEGTRFVVELELSRLGELQMDGLIRDKRFDLVLRSRRALPPAARADIARIFEEANAVAGLAGTVRFQASADWSFLPLTGTGAPAGLVV